MIESFKIFCGSALFANLLAPIFVVGSVGGAQAVSQFPQCHDVPVEFRIVRDFNWAEERTWRRGFEMIGLRGMHEHRLENYPGSEVTRRYCSATAYLNNGTHHEVYYMIEDVGGFVGQNWEVTHCVQGLDPWRNHDGNCRTMR